MTIRRSERDWSDEEELIEEEDVLQNIWGSNTGDSLRHATTLSELEPRQHGPIVHPAITDFGPASLSWFLHDQIDEAEAEGRLVHSKGKDLVSDGQRSRKAGGRPKRNELAESANGRHARTSPQKSIDIAAPPPSLQLAPDALLHLRGLKSKNDVSEVSNPADATPLTLPPSAASTNARAQRTTEVRRQTRTNPRRSCNLAKRPNEGAFSRGLDFAQHTREVRSRTRFEQDQRPAWHPPIPSGGGPADLPQLSLPSSRRHPSPRRRRVPKNLSHLNSFSDSDSDEDRHIRSYLGQPATAPADTVEWGGMSDDWLPSDEEENVDGLGGLFRNLTTDDSSPETEEAHEVRASDYVLFSPERTGGRRRWSGTRVKDAEVAYESLSFSDAAAKPSGIKPFSYLEVLPAEMPRIVIPRRTAKENKTPAPRPPLRVTTSTTSTRQPRRRSMAAGTHNNTHSEENNQASRRGKASSKREMKFSIKNDINQRKWDARYPPVSPMAPPACPADSSAPPRNARTKSHNTVLPFNYDVWADVVEYLAFEDLQNLRLTCKGFADEIAPLMLRSVVTRFGKSMFNTSADIRDSKKGVSLANSMLGKYGHEIHQFGVSFEYNDLGLAYATPKVTQKRQDAWYGSYSWPLETYPRFSELQELEDLVDNNRPLLKDSLGLLKGVNELGLSLDSGHGWLNGPDMSDLALFERRRKKGTKVFGPSFKVEDTWHTFGRTEIFRWAQQNSVNENLKMLSTRPDSSTARRKISEFQNMVIRDYDEFADEKSQPDFDPFSHTGGLALHPPPQQQQPPQPPNAPHLQQGVQPGNPAPTYIPAHVIPGPAIQPANLNLVQAGMLRRIRVEVHRHRNEEGDDDDQNKKSKGARKIPLQWPIIFNGYNLAADVGGRNNWIQNKVANPTQFPLIPGHLTEAQAQWLMETVWAQRAFLSAYTTAVITHKATLSKVHTLTIAKLSSGLLPSLAQKEFWASLSGLKRLKILVSPDWRNEHVPGDKFFATHMVLSPVTAASKFAEFLRTFVARVENLSHLTVGYVGGGENATGMFARNQHLMPAPITEQPRSWMTNHAQKADPSTLVKFDHIRDLTFENCWLSPCMLEAFMEKSRDTSLHTLVLDSVSMLSKHSTGIDGHLQTVRNGLRCRLDETDWLHEEVPSSATWTETLDKITPGVTILERKYAAGMIDADMEPMPAREFRGNVQKIVLQSCGYAKISGVKGDEFNQNALVIQSSRMMDSGLYTRRQLFDKFNGAGHAITDEDDGTGNNRPFVTLHAIERDGVTEAKCKTTKDLPVMMSMTDPATGSEWFGLGALTQCVHPIEKRVLEQAWGMKFGWGNRIERWASVEDGCFESGTGRFSGVILRDA
jgi:hypothetical protein